MEGVPPEVLFVGKLGCIFEGDSFYHIIIFMYSFNTSPEVEGLVVVLSTEFSDSDLNVDALIWG